MGRLEKYILAFSNESEKDYDLVLEPQGVVVTLEQGGNCHIVVSEEVVFSSLIEFYVSHRDDYVEVDMMNFPEITILLNGLVYLNC